ncbi:hypothetical protein Pelo_15767 [Pelomyxa schiedti]|nr:hypothetical protein Pelo_15767 [Pelomyxa schiedti]
MKQWDTFKTAAGNTLSNTAAAASAAATATSASLSASAAAAATALGVTTGSSSRQQRAHTPPPTCGVAVGPVASATAATATCGGGNFGGRNEPPGGIMGENQGATRGGSRDLTEHFLPGRMAFFKAYHDECERTVIAFRLLSHTAASQAQSKMFPQQQLTSSASRFFSSAGSLLSETLKTSGALVGAKSDSPTPSCCPFCRKIFSGFFVKQRQCPLCNRITCLDCNKSADYFPVGNSIDTSASLGQATMCLKCYSYLEHYRKKQKFDQLKNTAMFKRFTDVYDNQQLLLVLLHRRIEHLSYLVSKVDSNTSPEFKEAQDFSLSVTELSTSLLKGVKQISELQFEDKTNQKLQATVNGVFASQLQSACPQAAALQQKLKAIATQRGPMSILGVCPAIAPPSGAVVAITGENFQTGVEVYINGMKCKAVANGSGTSIQVVVPPTKTLGFACVKVVNPNGDSIEMPEVLSYSDL